MYICNTYTVGVHENNLLCYSVGTETQVKEHEQQFETGHWAPFGDSTNTVDQQEAATGTFCTCDMSSLNIRRACKYYAFLQCQNLANEQGERRTQRHSQLNVADQGRRRHQRHSQPNVVEGKERKGKEEK